MRYKTTNRISFVALNTIALLGMSCNLFAQGSSAETIIGIDAKIIAPITIINSGPTPLNFGTISRSSVEGTVTVTSDGGRTSDGGVSIVGSSDFSAAPFSVTGESYQDFVILLPTNAEELTGPSGSVPMTVSGFEDNSDNKLTSDGTASFSVGATLNIGANQMIGEYTGSFSVTVAYQ